MTTKQFIQKNLGETGKCKDFASVHLDEQGFIYSYWYHYPLVFNIKGHTFINTAGYSATTAKHIAWAKGAVDYNFTAVELTRDQSRVISNGFNTPEAKMQTLLEATERMIEEAQKACDAKKRKNTQVFKYLEYRLAAAVTSNIAVKNLIN